MNEYYGVAGEYHYLCNRDFSECYVFDNMGNLTGTKGSIADCRVVNKVDIVSIIPSSMRNKSCCEIYYKGMVKVFNKEQAIAMFQIRQLNRYMGTINRVRHMHKGTKAVLFDQLLLVLKKDAVSFADIDRVLPCGVGDWTPISRS